MRIQSVFQLSFDKQRAHLHTSQSYKYAYQRHIRISLQTFRFMLLLKDTIRWLCFASIDK